MYNFDYVCFQFTSLNSHYITRTQRSSRFVRQQAARLTDFRQTADVLCLVLCILRVGRLEIKLHMFPILTVSFSLLAST